MAKTSSVERNKKRERTGQAVRRKRAPSSKRSSTTATPAAEERFDAMLKLAELPRNSARRTGCGSAATITGRPRGNYRKFKLCRIQLRELGCQGPDPRHGQVELVGRRRS